MEIYADWTRRFLDAGYAYHCYCTPEELAARRVAARAAARIMPFLQVVGLVSDPVSERDTALIAGGAPLIQSRISRLTEAPAMLGFLFVDERHFTVGEDAAARSLTPDSAPALKAAVAALEELANRDSESIDTALRAALVEGLGLKPRTAFGPVRAAVTRRRVSPPPFQSIELLERERTLGRLNRALDSLG